MRRRHADCVEDGGEGFRSLGQLGEAVLHEAIPNNQPERNGSPVSYRRSIEECKTVAVSLSQWFAHVIRVQVLLFENRAVLRTTQKKIARVSRFGSFY